MQTHEWRNADRSKWPRGPWDSEPDKKQWEDPSTNLPCLILRNHSGAWCGYVGVPETHPLYMIEYSEEVTLTPERIAMLERPIGNLSPMVVLLASCREDASKQRLDVIFDVHGGLTFSAQCSPHPSTPERGICHLREPDDFEPWWFGFDCSHCDDMSPAYKNFGPVTYRDQAYVEAEVAKLALQLHNWK